MLKARPATAEDVGLIASYLRPEDEDELIAASGLTPHHALMVSFRHTTDPMVGTDEEDAPVCLGGVVPFGDGMRGAVWAVATCDVEHHRVSFLRRSIPWVHHWQSQYPILTNCVDERNTVHIEWLKWLGFTFINRHPAYGAARIPFLEFVRINPIV